MNSLGERLNQFETGFLNTMGHYPVASTVTGSVRSLLGVAELVAAVAGGALLLLGFILIVPATLDFTLNREDPLLTRLSRLTFNCFVQGSSNLGRGLVELVPGLNLLTCLYDKQGLRLDCLPYDEGTPLLSSPSPDDDVERTQMLDAYCAREAEERKNPVKPDKTKPFPRNCVAYKHRDGRSSDELLTFFSLDTNSCCYSLNREDSLDSLFLVDEIEEVSF